MLPHFPKFKPLELSDAEDGQLGAASAAFQPRRGLAAVPGLVSSAWMR